MKGLAAQKTHVVMFAWTSGFLAICITLREWTAWKEPREQGVPFGNATEAHVPNLCTFVQRRFNV